MLGINFGIFRKMGCAWLVFLCKIQSRVAGERPVQIWRPPVQGVLGSRCILGP